MRSTLPRICAFALALCCLVVSATAQTSAALDAALDVKEAAVATLKADIELGVAEMHNGTLQNWATDNCEIYSSCSSSLPNPRCEPNFGNTEGCDCNGRTIDYTAAVVKTSPKLGAPAHKVKKTACLAKHAEGNLTSLYTSLIEQGDGKWVYFGSNDGVLFNFPGFVWDTNVEDSRCGVDYDSRLRPWQMTAATGPKNVVLILDISGSMGLHGRLESMKTAAKKVVDAMTFADYVGVVVFNDVAESMYGLTTLAKALPTFRARIKDYIDGLGANAGTNFNAGFDKAFDLVDASVSRSYAANCHTTYVFLTDGEAASPASTIRSRQSEVTDEHYFIVSLGSGTNAGVLRQLSWDIGGIFSAVPDYEEEELQRALIGFYKYYALQKTLGKVEGFSWTEPYYSIPMIWGLMTSVSAPVYDKTREPWHMIGVASVDATVCDLEAKAPVGPPPPDPPQTVRDCTCKSSWTYNGRSFEGCSDVDWPVPWCAVQDGCGSCGTESVGPHGCWDDCKPTGSEASLRTELLDRATSWCAPTNASNLPSCALEALRISIDGQASSSHSCSAADLAYYKWAIDGEDDPVAGGMQFDLERTEGPIVGTEYDMDAGNCQCDDTMIPTCACASIPLPPPPPASDDEEEATVLGVIFGVIFMFALFGGALRFWYNCCCTRRDKPENPNVDAQGHFRPQQQQQGGVQMAQYGQPQYGQPQPQPQGGYVHPQGGYPQQPQYGQMPPYGQPPQGQYGQMPPYGQPPPGQYGQMPPYGQPPGPYPSAPPQYYPQTR